MTTKPMGDVLADLESAVSRGRAIASMLRTAWDDAGRQGENPDRIKRARDEMWYLVDRVEEEVGRLDALAEEAYTAWHVHRDRQGDAAKPPLGSPAWGEVAPLTESGARALEAGAEELKAASLLDQALQARHDSLTAASRHEDYEHPDAVAADDREDEAAASLAAFDSGISGVAVAQLAWLVASSSEACEGNVFEFAQDGSTVAWLDFAAGAEIDHRGAVAEILTGAARIVAQYLEAHPDSPLAKTISKHRALGTYCSATPIAAE